MPTPALLPAPFAAPHLVAPRSAIFYLRASPNVYQHFNESRDKLTQIRAAHAVVVVAKLAEVLEESAAYYKHECETDISLICDAVRSSTHRKGDAILASFEKTLRYHGQAAEKAVRARRKNVKEAEAKAKAETSFCLLHGDRDLG